MDDDKAFDLSSVGHIQKLWISRIGDENVANSGNLVITVL